MASVGAATLREDVSAAPPSGGSAERWLRAALVTAVVAGVVFRVIYLVLPTTGALDADEAITGLMALQALEQGEVGTFFWGQSYGGSLEPLLAVPLFAAFGPSLLVLRLVPMALSALAAVLVWRIGRRTVGHRAGLVAAAAVWAWPATMVWFATKGRGFYWVCLVAGLTFLLLVLHLVADPDRRWAWLALGLVGGIGWWSSPQIVYFAVPGLVWLVAQLRGRAWQLARSVPAAVVGALPWLTFNARNGWSSLDAGSHAHDAGMLGNLEVLATQGLRVILGLHVDQRWLVPVAPPVVWLLVGAAAVLAVARRPSGAGLLVLGAAVYPLLYAAFPVSGVVGEGRYLLFLLPYLALLVAHAAGRAALQAAFVAGAVALSALGIPHLDGGTAPLALDRLVPPSIAPVLDELERRGVDVAVADYWVAYRITFETGGDVVAAPLTNDRHPAHTATVLSDPEGPAWVFVERTALVPAFEAELARRHVPYERVVTGGFVVYFPEDRVVCWPGDPGVGAPCG